LAIKLLSGGNLIMDTKSEKNRLLIADVIAQSWKNPEYLRNLVANPKKVLSDAGVEGLTDDIQLHVLENTARKKHLVFPAAEIQPTTYLPLLSEMLQKSLPLPEADEIVLMQNTAKVLYIVIPMAPRVSGINMDASHVQLLMEVGWEAINLWTSANAAAEVNAAVWANVAGVTLAVAVAAIVLI
jgi:hypothetical protein